MVIAYLQRGMRAVGVEDVLVTRKIADASGEWGHLSVFAPDRRESMATYLGLVPSYDKYASAWRVWGLPLEQLASLGVAFNMESRSMFVWPDGPRGSDLVNVLAGCTCAEDIYVMGDPAMELAAIDDRVVPVVQPVQISQADVDAVCEVSVDAPGTELADEPGLCVEGSSGAVVPVKGTGMFDVVEDGLERFIADMQQSGLDGVSAEVLRAMVVDQTCVGSKACGVRGCDHKGPGFHHGTWKAGAVKLRNVYHGNVPLGMDALTTAASVSEYADSAYDSSSCFDPEVKGCYRTLFEIDSDEKELSFEHLFKHGKMRPPDVLAQYTIVRTSPVGWHVTRYGRGLNALAVMDALGLEYIDGGTMAMVNGQVVSFSDTLGSPSLMALAIVEQVDMLGQVDLDGLDSSGMALAGSSPAILGSDDKNKLRMLQACGDAVITLCVATHCLNAGKVVQSYQEMRSAKTSNRFLAAQFVASTYAKAFHGVGGEIAPRTASDAVEAIAGVLYEYRGVDCVMQFLNTISFWG